jgi:uncharacterized protein YpmS
MSNTNSMKKIKVILLIIFVIVLSSLACNLSFGRQEKQGDAILVTTESVESLQESAQEAVEGAIQSGDIEFVITEAQLTSLLTFELQERIGDQISNLQVLLQDGQIQLFGDVDTQGISATVRVIVSVRVDPVGRPVLEVVSSSIGPFPVPGELVSEVEMLMNKAFQEKIDSMAPNMHIESIVIENGMMTIIGRSK